MLLPMYSVEKHLRKTERTYDPADVDEWKPSGRLLWLSLRYCFGLFFSFNHLFKFAADIPDDGSLTVLEALIHRRLQVPSVSLSPSINILL